MKILRYIMASFFELIACIMLIVAIVFTYPRDLFKWISKIFTLLANKIKEEADRWEGK